MITPTQAINELTSLAATIKNNRQQITHQPARLAQFNAGAMELMEYAELIARPANLDRYALRERAGEILLYYKDKSSAAVTRFVLWVDVLPPNHLYLNQYTDNGFNGTQVIECTERITDGFWERLSHLSFLVTVAKGVKNED